MALGTRRPPKFLRAKINSVNPPQKPYKIKVQRYMFLNGVACTSVIQYISSEVQLGRSSHIQCVSLETYRHFLSVFTAAEQQGPRPNISYGLNFADLPLTATRSFKTQKSFGFCSHRLVVYFATSPAQFSVFCISPPAPVRRHDSQSAVVNQQCHIGFFATYTSDELCLTKSRKERKTTFQL